RGFTPGTSGISEHCACEDQPQGSEGRRCPAEKITVWRDGNQPGEGKGQAEGGYVAAVGKVQLQRRHGGFKQMTDQIKRPAKQQHWPAFSETPCQSGDSNQPKQAQEGGKGRQPAG